MMNRNKCVLAFLTFCMAICLMGTTAQAADKNGVDWDKLLEVPEDAARQEANPEDKMAHNIYVDPDLSATSGKFSGFMVDFKADKAGTSTFWSFCTWEMNKDDLHRQYAEVEGGGAYAGLQVCPDGPNSILSFWEINCKDAYGNEKKIQAKRVYPSAKKTNKFDGEGEGTNYIYGYQWKAGRWYRMYLNCYQGKKGKTYVEQWIADLSTGKWTLITRFDTGLYYSYFEGTMSQFMENFEGCYANETRTFEFRNMRVREYASGRWKSIRNATLSVDTCWDNKKGNAVFGATKDRFYGIANGYGPDAFELNQEVVGTFRVTPTKNMYIPSTKGKNKATQILIDSASLSKSSLKRIVKINKVKKIYLKGLKKSKVKKYKKWIRQANRKTKVVVK